MPPSPAKERPTPDATSILSALDIDLRATRLPIGYLAVLLLVLAAWAVLLAMYVLLVLGFLAVAVAAAGAVFKSEGFWELVFTGSVAVGGLVVAGFLMKPLFAPRPRSVERPAVNEASEPLLFAYIEKLARLVGSRPPDRIVLDTHVNASAGHLDLLNVSRGRLELTLGLPLVTGLSLRELTGVLAHEFGHFRQGLGARLGAVVHRLNGWFYRAAFVRDSWDESLGNVLDDTSLHGIVRLPFLLAAIGIRLGRGFLSLELRIGAALGSFWGRRLERDADRWEAALSGGTGFAETVLKLRVLEVSSQRAHDDLTVAYREGRLVDDLPGLVAAHASAMPRDVVSRIRNAMLARRTGSYDSHPSDLDRIEAARSAGPGLFRLDAPASALFSDLACLNRATTLRYYREEIGLEVSAKYLVSLERLLPAPPATGTNGEAPGFFQGALSRSRPFFPDYASVPALPPNARGHMARLRASFQELAPKAREAGREIDRAYDVRMRVAAAERLIAARVPFRPAAFNLPAATAEGLAQARDRAAKIEATAMPAVTDFEKTARQRLLLALALLRDPELPGVGAPPAAESLQKAAAFLGALAAMQRGRADIEALEIALTALEPILAVLSASEAPPEALASAAYEILDTVQERLRELQRKIGTTLYPWGHVDGAMTLARYLVPESPPAGEWLRVRAMAHDALDRYVDTHGRLLREVGTIAESVEKRLGLDGEANNRAFGAASSAPRQATSGPSKSSERSVGL